ncbi:MAG: peptidoglycan D,D-transpeptidase FtsI family protein [Sciscionella sp.]
MNTPLRRVGLAMIVMVLLLLVNATYIQVIKADDYRSDPRNQRVLLDEYSRQRGLILDTDSDTIANVKSTNDRLRYQRIYPKGPLYAPVTGYYSVLYGSSGIEQAEDEVLNGSDDRLFVRRLSDLITGRDPRGGNVQLAIDPKVQKAAYDAMTASHFRGAVVAIKPDTGEILGMVSTPSYNPNPLSSHDSKTQQQAKTKLDAEANRPLTNRAIDETYPPGSTFKLVVASAALSKGMGPNTRVPSEPTIALPAGGGTTLSNFAFETCPGNTMFAALAHSCNTAFAYLAGRVGAQSLRNQAAKFGIGQSDLQIPLPVAASSVGDIADKASLYQSGIGQRDVRLTPLQNAMVSATIANGGVRMTPQLVKKILAPDLETVQDFSPQEEDQAISPQVAETLKRMMEASEDNTSGGGKRPDIRIASKTGTAEHGTDPKNTPPHAWYTAFAPADNPQIAVAVIVEDGGNRGLAATGGKVAASIGRAAINARVGGG